MSNDVYLQSPDGDIIPIPEGQVTVGRKSDNTIVINNRNVSRRHALLERRETQVWLTDLGSANGTFVNGGQLVANRKYPLDDGHLIGFGQQLNFTIYGVIPASDLDSEGTLKGVKLADMAKVVAIGSEEAMTTADFDQAEAVGEGIAMKGSTGEELLYFNGINGVTGEYGLSPMTAEKLAEFIRGEAEPENLNELRLRHQQKDQKRFGVKEGIDPGDLAEAGWGVIFAHDAGPAIKEALSELLDLRREQAGPYFRVYEGSDGYRPNEPKNKFLSRHGAGPGPADPEIVPYYLLIVGSPEAIPYRFQYQLDVQYAVGRIHFNTPEEYANYARSVVTVERGVVKLPRRISFFGVANEGDKATNLGTENLIEPLFNQLWGDRPDWDVSAFVKDEATKAQLARLLGGDQTPALLFTASHGVEFPVEDSRQISHQGALLCQDWPGPNAWRGQGPIPQDYYFAGDDLTGEASLLGLLTFFFACYGAGTPLNDEFSGRVFKTRKAISPYPFVAGLPAGLLSHPRGGALAAIGLVERAWGYSFMWPGASQQTAVFQSTLERLLNGHPVGAAIEYFNERNAELASDLSVELEEIEYGKRVDPYELTGMWTANNDARSCVVIGDPAVRLPVAGPDELPGERPVIEVKPTVVPVMPVPPPPPAPARSAPPPPSTSAFPAPSPLTPKAATPSRSLIEIGDEQDDALDEILSVFGVEDDLSGLAVDDEKEVALLDFSPPVVAADEVQFSAYHPRAITPGTWHKLLVYAHLSTALEAVQIDTGQILGREAESYRQAQAEASTTIAPGTEITVVPQAAGLEFEPPQASLTWDGAWQRADFEMRATGQRIGHVIEGSIACYVGPLLIADIRLPVVVTSPAEAVEEMAQPQEVQSAKMYRAVFASYSHADTAIVEAVETAYEALGMDYLRDVMTLKSGQSWSDELFSMIDRADVFQLFWSTSANQSPYVEQEWRHALTLADQKSPAFIRPVYWEKPMPAVPEALSHIHFAPVDFADLVRPATQVRSQVASATSVEQIGLVSPPEPQAETLYQLADFLPTEGEALKSLTVSTYATDDLAEPGQTNLKARTHISLTGDVETYLPEVITVEDERYLELHQAIVQEAIRARLAYLKLIAQLTTDTSE